VSFSGGGGSSASGTATIGDPDDNTGEPEMISNKSRRNIYRYNTLLNNYGQLCLRQGDYCTIQGNYFLAGGAYDGNGNIVLTETRNNQMGGVRAFGFGHVIANNYFYKLNGDGIRSALILGSGGTPTGTLLSLTNGANGAAYETVNYAQVIGNSFIDCNVLTLDNPNGELYPVYGTTFFNNLVYYSANISGSGLIGNTDAGYGSLLLSDHGGRAAGNYVYSATSTQLGSAAALLGSMWMSETFVGYTNGQTLTNKLSPTLIASSGNPSYYTKITNDGGNVAQYLKPTTNNGSQVMFAFSPTNTMTVRTNGYVSFRIKQNIDTNIPTANALDVGIGNNVSATTTSSSANRLIGLAFKQSGTTTNTIVVSSAGAAIGNTFTNTNSTSFSKVEIWFNDSDTNSFSYINPSGVSMNLATNSFVVYLNSNLVTTTNSGNAPLYSGTNSSGGIPAVGSLNIGKIGFSTASTGTINFSFDDILTGAANNTISSASKDDPLMSGKYDVLTVPAANSPLLGRASVLPVVNDTSASVSSTGTPFDLAGTVATYGSLDMRGLTRPATGRDIGNFEVEATGTGNRPLRRTEVGIVAATYPTAIQANSITQGVFFSQQLTTSFGTGALTWSSASALPGTMNLSSTGVLSGTASAPGTYPITIRVTDANGSYAETNLILTVISSLSSNANLADLVLSSGSLSPSFNSDTVSYTATVSNLVSIQVTSTAAQSNATVKVNGAIVTSGMASGGIRLQTGTNVITNMVTAQDGATTKIYKISVVQNDAFDVLRAKWRNSLIGAGGTSNDSNALKYWTGSGSIPAINVTPSSSAFYLWSDLPLNTSSSGNMRDTFDRLQQMALAYATPGSAYYGNATLAATVANGLDWMVANVYNGSNIYDNWYHWMISGAENFANAALLVYPALTESQITSYYTKLQDYSPSGGPRGLSLWETSYRWTLLTGSNIAEAAFVMTLNGILYKSSVKLTEGRTNLLRVFPTATSGDGFYSDGGYIFHWNAVENGSYGLDLIIAVTNVTDLLYGSAWALVESDSSKVYSTWIPEGLMPFYYQGALMHMIRGRSYTSSGSTGLKAGDEGIVAMRGVANWSFIPETEKGKLTAFANTPHPAVGQYMFPSIDRVVAHRSNFSLGLSLSSSRTCNWDPMRNTPSTQNNDKGWNTADGMTSLYVGSTDTHFTDDIWPTMDWYHLTGTTSEQNYETDPGTPEENWAGGAEVSGYGVAGMILHPADFVQAGVTNHSTLRAKKSYFMLEKEVVCLGAGVSCGSTNIVDTTVENRRMGSNTTSVNLWVDGVSTSRALNWGTTLTNSRSCAIEGVGGYYFPDRPNNLRAEFVPSFGKWTDVHPTDSKTNNYTNNYLRLIFNHGANPSGATYAYTLLPAMNPTEVAGYAYNPQTTILSNTATIQAVKNIGLGIVAANFWDSAGGKADLLTVNRSCSVITKEAYNSIAVGISDPSQNLSGPNGIITVTLDRSGTLLSKDSEVSVTRTNPTIEFTVNVSEANGKTIHAIFTPATAAPQITSSVNLVALTGLPVSYQIASDTSGATYAVTGLPPGLTLYESGLIYGTPTTSGIYTATISATSSAGRVGYTNLTIQVSDNLSGLSTPYGTSGTWVCPANVTEVQVECWGGGGAGGSAYKPVSGNAYGGGGAGGAYAKRNSAAVVPGASYTINIGLGGVSSAASNATVSGADSWFGNSTGTNCLAKGGAGGQSVISSSGSTNGIGGVGSTSGSLGDIVYAGGNGLLGQSSLGTGGGGGGSGGTSSTGSNASSYLGATAVTGGGAGGNGKDSTGNGDGSQGGSPGGGGGGARGSSPGSQTKGGAGGSGQVILTLRMKTNSTISISGGTFSYSGSPQGPGLESVTKTGSTNPNLTYRYEGVAPTVYSASSSRPMEVGTYTVTATVPEDSDSMAAVSNSAPFSIVPASPTFSGLFGSGVDPAGIGTDGLAYLMKYALGGTNTNDKVSLPTVSINGSTLTMTAVVRTNDTNVQIVGQWIPDLTGTWSNTPTNPYGRASTNTNNVPTGCQRRDFSVEKDTNSRLFLRLKASQ